MIPVVLLAMTAKKPTLHLCPTFTKYMLCALSSLLTSSYPALFPSACLFSLYFIPGNLHFYRLSSDLLRKIPCQTRISIPFLLQGRKIDFPFTLLGS